MGTEYKNRVLSSLSRAENARLQPNLKRVLLPQNRDLALPGENVPYAYFLEDGMASIIVTMQNGASVEVGVVGREGLVGLPVLFGTGQIPTHTFMQISGSGFRIKSQHLKAEFDRPGKLRDNCGRYFQSHLVQVSSTAACNRVHNIEERLARWLLLCQDRTTLSRLPLTHEFLAQMLGTGRATVSLAAEILQRAKLIEYSRGKVDVLDRKGLEAAACECYRIIRDEDDRLGVLDADLDTGKSWVNGN
ncbi:MAG TPA: Crp/Fnr family transcriptional regulator [Candidatus Angelobacter sp.]|jgi:CRP-like cAMP-binding protein